VSVLDSGKRLLDNLLGALLTRLDLFSVEVREEVIRLIQLLILVSAALFCAGLTLILVTFTVIFGVWEDHQARVWAMSLFTAFYALLAVGSGLTVRQMLLKGGMPFSETVNQLKKDRECLKFSRSGN
jgi:uncharacterized membrane protein YqjE